MTTEPRLRDLLHDDARHLEPTAPALAEVRRRHAAHHRRRRTGVAVVGVLGLAGGVVAWSSIDDGPTRLRFADGGPADATSGTPPPELAWETLPATVGWYAERSVTTASGVTYVLSTAPGTGIVATPGAEPDAGQALYRTTDGKEWATVQQSERWMSKLAVDGDVLYAVGTAPTAAGGVAARFGVSTDEGRTWDRQEVPLDLDVPKGAAPLGSNVSVNLAAGPGGTVLLQATVRSWPDTTAFDTADSVAYPEQDATGFLVRLQKTCTAVSPAAGDVTTETAMVCDQGEPEVVGHLSWADLGLSGPDDLVRQILLRRDGDRWTPLTTIPEVADARSLIGTPEGFVLVSDVKGDTTTYTSADGVAWTRRSVLPAGFQFHSAAGNRLVAMDYRSSRMTTSADGGLTWHENRALPALQPGGTPLTFTEPAAGPLGFAVVAGPGDAGPESTALLFSTDGITWSTTQLADVGLGEDMSTQWVSVGADHVVVGIFRPGPKDRQVSLVATPKAP